MGQMHFFYSNCRLGARITHYSMHIPIKMKFTTTESNFNTKKRTGIIYRGKLLLLFVIIFTFSIKIAVGNLANLDLPFLGGYCWAYNTRLYFGKYYPDFDNQLGWWIFADSLVINNFGTVFY